MVVKETIFATQNAIMEILRICKTTGIHTFVLKQQASYLGHSAR